MRENGARAWTGGRRKRRRKGEDRERLKEAWLEGLGSLVQVTVADPESRLSAQAVD